MRCPYRSGKEVRENSSTMIPRNNWFARIACFVSYLHKGTILPRICHRRLLRLPIRDRGAFLLNMNGDIM